MRKNKNEPESDWLTPFRLSEPHTHAGKDYAPGDVILLRADQVENLATLGKGEVTTFGTFNNKHEGEKNAV